MRGRPAPIQPQLAGPRRDPWARLDTMLLVSITAIAGAIRLFRESTPAAYVFDEYWYARDGCWYVKASRAVCRLVGASDRDVSTWLRLYGEMTPEHPPLGKWLTGSGIAVFGNTPSAWRLAAIAAGTITVALIYITARLVYRSSPAAILASGLLTFEPLHFVHSRLAMLEIFVATFAAAAFLFLAVDRERMMASGWPGDRSSVSPAGWRARWTDDRWRFASGAAAGAAAASKASGWLVVLALPVVTLAWEAARRDGDGRYRGLTRAIREEAPSMVLPFIVTPVAIYVASYVGRIDGRVLTWPWSDGAWAREFLARQEYMWRFFADRPPSLVRAFRLPMFADPMTYYLNRSAGDYQLIVAGRDPLVWWLAFGAVLLAMFALARKRDVMGPESFVIAGVAATYSSWVLLAASTQQVFIFYFVPVVPFACLALGYPVALMRAKVDRVVVEAALAVVVALFVFVYPLLSAVRVPRDAVVVRAPLLSVPVP